MNLSYWIIPRLYLIYKGSICFLDKKIWIFLIFLNLQIFYMNIYNIVIFQTKFYFIIYKQNWKYLNSPLVIYNIMLLHV